MTLRRRLIRILLILLLLPPILAGIAGWLVAPGFLHPIRRELTPDLIREADASFAHSGGHREDFNVRAPDGILLRAGSSTPIIPTATGSFSSTASPTTASGWSATPNFYFAPVTASS